MNPVRKILHVDADCFYAAVETLDDPSLRGIPIAVGGSSDRRGVISTANYEARRFGVKSAMASAYARRLCPELLILPGRMERYREVSLGMRQIFSDYTDLIEPLSLDEAYLDVSMCRRCNGSATRIAQEIRQRVLAELGITVSVGVASNKFIAKVASDWDKPDGLTVVSPANLESFVEALPVAKIHGVGKVTAERLHKSGIRTCGDLRRFSQSELVERHGRFGLRLFQMARGIDDRPVKTDRIRKSLSVERTYPEDLHGAAACEAQLPDLFARFQIRLASSGDEHRIAAAFVKVKFSNFATTTLERSFAGPNVQQFRDLLVEAIERYQQGIRLLGIGVRFRDSQSDGEGEQLSLF